MSRITTITFIFAAPGIFSASIPISASTSAVVSLTEGEADQRATGLAPPAYLNTLAASPSVFRCQILHPLLGHQVCQLCQKWPPKQRNPTPP